MRAFYLPLLAKLITNFTAKQIKSHLSFLFRKETKPNERELKKPYLLFFLIRKEAKENRPRGKTLRYSCALLHEIGLYVCWEDRIF